MLFALFDSFGQQNSNSMEFLSGDYNESHSQIWKMLTEFQLEGISPVVAEEHDFEFRV